MGRAIIFTEPAEEPISFDEAKDHLNLTSQTKDNYVDSLIKVARRMVERYLQRALITQTWDLYLPDWRDCIDLHYPPLISITSVVYKNLLGADTTLTHGNYMHVVTADTPGKLIRKYGVTFPQVEYGNPDAIKIRYVAGYGSSESVPEDIKHAMKLILTDLYEHRGTVVIGNIAHKIPNHIADLIHSYKVYRF
jgi:uncharacterized phiE125 gp8 family phage protein